MKRKKGDISEDNFLSRRVSGYTAGEKVVRTWEKFGLANAKTYFFSIYTSSEQSFTCINVTSSYTHI